MKTYFIYFMLLVVSLHTKAQVFGLDSSFGMNARQTFSRATGNSALFDAEVQSDGKLLSSGYINNVTQDLLVVRNFPNGSLDNSYGINGSSMIDLGGDEIINDLALQADGKALVCGLKKQTGQVNKFILARLKSNGTLDSSFGTQGSVIFSAINGDNSTGAVFRNVRIQTNGKIVVVGYAFINSIEYRGIVQRYQTNGQLDSTFGTDGSRYIKFTNGSHNYGESIYLLASGKILVLGSAYFTSFGHRIMKLNADGTNDNSFGINGVISSVFSGFSNVYPNWITELSDGKIQTIGYAYNGTNQKVYSSRHLSTGALDNSYAINGIANYAATIGNNYAYDAILLNNGECSIPTESYNATTGIASIIRIDSLGNLMNSFGTNGISNYSIADFAYGNAIAANQDSLYLVGGLANNTNRFDQGYITKVDHVGNQISSFANTGIIQSESGKSISLAQNILLMNSGNLYITGTHSNSNKDQFVAKINPNGNPVTSFGDQGFAIFDLEADENVEDAIKLTNENILLLSETGKQTITFTAPAVTLSGPTHYSFSVIDSNGANQVASQSNFTITASQFPGVKAIREDNNGKFIVLASSSQAVISNHFLIRHNANFSLDNSYGTSGKISTPGRTTSNFTTLGDIQIAPDNDVVLLNWFSNTFSTPFTNFTLRKYKEDGNLDANFGNFGIYTNEDTVGSDPSGAIHLWKFSNGYYIDYYKDNLAKIQHVGFNGFLSNFGTAVLGDVIVSDMKQLPDSSFIILCNTDSIVKIYHYFANGVLDTNFNFNGSIEELPFLNSKSLKGFALYPDTSMVIYHQMNTNNKPAYLGMSK